MDSTDSVTVDWLEKLPGHCDPVLGQAYQTMIEALPGSNGSDELIRPLKKIRLSGPDDRVQDTGRMPTLLQDLYQTLDIRTTKSVNDLSEQAT